MSNYTLLVSSLIMSAIHGITLFHYPNVSPLYAFLLLRGLLSSIYNHASSNSFSMLYDRAVMRESFFVDLFYMTQTNTLKSAGVSMCMAVMLYFSSKILLCDMCDNPFTKHVSDLLHICAHLGITVAHVIVITYY